MNPAVRAWASSRAVVWVTAVMAGLWWGAPERGVSPHVPVALSHLGGWDTTWYLDVADHGYPVFTGLVGTLFTPFAFFPLLPGVMAAGAAVGANPFLVGLAAANLGFLVALAAFHRLTAHGMGGPDVATPATWVLALAPMSAYAALAYTEGVVLALAVCAALLATRGRFAAAGLLGAAAALARPPGLLVAVLVVAIAVTADRPARTRVRDAVLGGLPAVAALGGFLAWMQYARGSWRLPLDAQDAWDRGPLLVGLVTHLPGTVADAVRAVATMDVTARWTEVVRDGGMGAVYVLLLARLWRDRGGPRDPWVLYSALTLAVPLSSGSIGSLARFGLMAFPLAWPAAAWIGEGGTGRRRRVLGVALVVTVLLVAQLHIRAP